VQVLANQNQRFPLRQGLKITPEADQQLVLEGLTIEGRYALGGLPLQRQA
jgi:hypothetical protein